jgi:hypothetical protein
MAQIDVLRPISVLVTGSGIAVPSGTLATVTADNSDATYIRFDEDDYGDNWSLRVESHTPPANHQRHRLRGRIRIRTDTGFLAEDIDVGRAGQDYIDFSTIQATASFTEQQTSWFQDPEFGLATAGALADLNIGGGWPEYPISSPTQLRTSECYIDIDCRARPDYTADVLDASGASQNGGTVTDTDSPTLYFGAVSYDGLPALNWSVTVGAYSNSGSGTPPTSVVAGDLLNGSYTATFTVRSTIRGSDAFEHVQTINFDVDFQATLPSPPALTVEQVDDGIELTWTDPGGTPWDDDYAVIEIFRRDCHSDEFVRIATIEDALNGTYLDRNVPTRDETGGAGACAGVACELTYRARYWGTVSETIEVPSTIPEEMIIGWPGTVGTIPTGWSRVTALDGLYPRGASGAMSGATGGTATHSHTTPGHTHTVNGHDHALGGNTGTSNTSTTSARFNGASETQADQPHSHSRPARTGASSNFTSGSSAPGTNSVDNLPPTREVIWIDSDGARTAFPADALAFARETISGWERDATSNGRFLKGAATAGNGGASVGSSTHTHTVDAHTHTGSTHNHTVASTGLSNPLSSIEAGYGVSSPPWLPRHTHPMSVASAATGSTDSAGGGTTSAGDLEPPNRRLEVVRNLAGGLQVRVIGLFRGDTGDLPSTLTLCDGSNGTPDMRGWFARDRGSASMDTTGGTSTHSHTTSPHGHTMPSHAHTTSVGTSTTSSLLAPSFGDLGDSPTTSHTHTSGATFSATPTVQSAAAGTTNTVSHVPPYEDVHFVRLDGVGTEPLEVPQVLTSEFAESTIDALSVEEGMDRIVADEVTATVCTDRSLERPRWSIVSVPLAGGLPTVATTVPGQDVRLTISVVGKDTLTNLETALSDTLVYYAPYGGTPGWYAPTGWQATPQTPRTWQVSVTMTEQPAPETENPEDLL